MVISDTTGPLPKGIGHIMRMTLLAPKIRDLDLTREPILFLSPPSRGESLVGVTTTPVTSTSPAILPLTKWLLRGSGISRCPFLIRGVMVVGGCPSHRQTWSTALGGTVPCQSIPSWVISGCVIHQGRWQSCLWLERSSRGREGRVQLPRREPEL